MKIVNCFKFILIIAIASVYSCNNGDNTVTPDIDNIKIDELDFFEKELVAKWSRYHAYDGSTDYMIFNLDRTMCKWEKPSSGGKKDYVNYTYWKLVKKTGSDNVFKIYKGKSKDDNYNSGDEYHYNEDEIWRGGYSNLRMYHTTSAITCDKILVQNL